MINSKYNSKCKKAPASQNRLNITFIGLCHTISPHFKYNFQVPIKHNTFNRKCCVYFFYQALD